MPQACCSHKICGFHGGDYEERCGPSGAQTPRQSLHQLHVDLAGLRPLDSRYTNCLWNLRGSDPSTVATTIACGPSGAQTPRQSLHQLPVELAGLRPLDSRYNKCVWT
jgi:hypothetical protein